MIKVIVIRDCFRIFCTFRFIIWCVCFVKSVWVQTMASKYVLLGLGVSIAAIAVMVGVSVLS